MARRRNQENDALTVYRSKRRFENTPEPQGSSEVVDGYAFVIQKHAATHLHYDLRLQFGSVLKSWAVTKGPSLNPRIKRHAAYVEEHPVDYAGFEGLIPEGEYGGGSVIVWDRGTWAPMEDPNKGFEKGLLKFRLDGEKLGGGWTLVRLETKTSWLLVKDRDIFVETDADILEARPESVLSGRTIEDIATDTPSNTTKRILRPSRIKGAHKEQINSTPRPQLPTLVARPASGPGWLHEIKYDGYRFIAVVDGQNVKLLTRNGHDWTDRCWPIADALKALKCKEAIIDGEVVVQDKKGASDFQALVEALKQREPEGLVFYAFDLLHLNGYDLTQSILIDRKQTLAALLKQQTLPASIQYSDHLIGKADEFFSKVSQLSLEGIVSKKVDATYRAGRTQTWTKTKTTNTDDFMVVGFTRSGEAGGLGALLLAEGHDSKLSYVGKVGTGWTAANADHILDILEASVQKMAPLSLLRKHKAKGIVWVKPDLMAEVQFRTRTKDNLLRHPVFKRIREDKRSTSQPRYKAILDTDLAQVWITNPDRRMFSSDGPTKLDLALYYANVGDWMLTEITDRPLSLVRCPTGDVKDSFYQRHRMLGMPDGVQSIHLREEGGKRRSDFIYIKDGKSLLSLAQFGVVEIHPWGCRVDKPERPDRLIIDLDPDEGLDWREVVDAAFQLRNALLEINLRPFLKTTGGKGLHLVVPIRRRTTWPQLKKFASAFAEKMVKQDPSRYTASPTLQNRHGRIYIDYLRNARGATAVAAYSLRAKIGAPASCPLHWEELADLDNPMDLNYATIPGRLNVLESDPWEGMMKSACAITRTIEDNLGINK